MDEQPIDNEELDRLMAEELDKALAERDKEIEDLGFPEWAITIFLRFRRLAETLRSKRPCMKYDEIADKINEILQPCPKSLFDYDEKCRNEFEAACLEMKRLIEEKGID